MNVQLHQVLETTPQNCEAALAAAALERIDRRLMQDIATVRTEMRESETALRRDIQALSITLGAAMDERSAELLKWGLLFWIGQAAATGTIVAGLLMLTFG